MPESYLYVVPAIITSLDKLNGRRGNSGTLTDGKGVVQDGMGLATA